MKDLMINTDRNGNYSVSSIVCIRKFKVTDENGNERVYGDKDKVYILETTSTYYCKYVNM